MVQVTWKQLHKRLPLTIGHFFDDVPLVRRKEENSSRFSPIEVGILMASEGAGIADAVDAKYI